jgi:3-oxoacyl-[acyl-carrier-protein] synthase-3
LEGEGMNLADIDFFVFHQANYQMLEVLRKKLRISKEKFIIEMEDVGNTVSASIPIAFSRAFSSGKIKSGDRVMLCSFGIGLSWAGTIIQV